MDGDDVPHAQFNSNGRAHVAGSHQQLTVPQGQDHFASSHEPRRRAGPFPSRPPPVPSGAQHRGAGKSEQVSGA